MKTTFAKLSVSEKEKWAKALAKAGAYGEGLTDEEDAKLHAAALADPDAPPLPDDANLVTYQEARRRGRPRVPNPKRQVTMRLDGDVIDRMRALGDGWQVKANAVLKDWLEKVG
ncbi:BrnA antitoxin family protein [Labrys monachus]|uniref:Uncharacterized protein (DUF4415 family) n=1 Tax=Labrys monachus TaxID=217067 RepID=A0ABU0FKQ2_9HYPH|nr:BrnA antitoxin family protein [Labrys monachus]MDQ0395179.1 uncharacterized protein (DUF4415 family) [Labrys monachus]